MYIADLHIHSKYSRATSRDCTPEYLDLWARRKGIQIVGTGDFTHPAWREELEEKLEPEEEGLYVLKEEYRLPEARLFGGPSPRFVITGEISSIYKKDGRVRKVHSLILLPGLKDARKVSFKLETIGNIHSDGRPILGVDCRDLLEIVLELVERAVYVPAHIWTPHFSLFGAFSGFDSVEECFGDLSSEIHAMETGLSSDPPMNWRISALDRFQLISNSDAHSPAKLGREANLMDIPLSYEGVRRAIQTGEGLLGTIEFFPEEGKYHFDGHRKCHLCLSPQEAIRYGGMCPVCGKKLTIGVSHRVEELADRPEGFRPQGAKRFESLVPLPEVIGASVGHSAASAKVLRQYEEMLTALGSEFDILRRIPLEEIRSVSGYLISEGVRRLREGQVERMPGFDGEYGTIRLFTQAEIENLDGQMSLFDEMELGTQDSGGFGADRSKQSLPKEQYAQAADREAAASLAQEEPDISSVGEKHADAREGQSAKEVLNEQQREAVQAVDRAIAVVAGPGTGKTKTLVSRILYLLETRKVRPSEITAVTFTNQAAGELRERVQKQLGKRRSIRQMQVGTFHSICLELLRKAGRRFSLADETETMEIAEKLVKDYSLDMKAKKFLEQVSRKKTQMKVEKEQENFMAAFRGYQEWLAGMGMLDFDDLLLEAAVYMEQEEGAKEFAGAFSYLLVDEFQDSNPIQYRLMKAWNKRGRELFVIGDPDQSIYGFRGSDAECFEKLKDEFDGLRMIRLVENYRSVPAVTKSALKVISANPGPARSLHANREAKTKVRLVQAGSSMGEAIFIAKEINRLVGGLDMLEAQEGAFYQDERKPRSFDQIAVLYRTHRQGELLETCLRREGIPYVVAGREDFLEEEKVRGCVCFFRYLENPLDMTAGRLCLKLIWGLECNEITGTVLEAVVEKYRPSFAKGKPAKILEQWMGEMGLVEDEGMKKLAGMALFYKNMPEFMKALYLGVESDLKRCGERRVRADAVTLMTLHGSKGLEFPVTMIYGVNKGLIPYESEAHPADVREERRLFYVGMTRAKEELILTTSKEESCFLGELPPEWVCREDADKRKLSGGEQLSLFDFLKKV